MPYTGSSSSPRTPGSSKPKFSSSSPHDGEMDLKISSSSPRSPTTFKKTESASSAPKTPNSAKGGKKKAVKKMLEAPTSAPARNRSKSPGRLKARKSGEGKEALLEAPTSAPNRSRSKSPGKFKEKHKRSSSKGKDKPAWWNLENMPSLDDDDDPGERLLQNVHQQKHSETKPAVMANIRATPIKIDLDKFQPVSYPMETTQKKLIKTAAKENFILKEFVQTGAKPDIKKLIHAFEPVNVNQGQIIVEEGTQGDHFYVVESGQVEVCEDDGKMVGTLKAGSTFGDRNLLYQAPWNCSVRAAATSRDPIRVMRLNTNQYKGIMATTEEANEKRHAPPPSAKATPLARTKSQQDQDDWVVKSQDMALIKTLQAALKKLSQDDLERIKVLGEGQFGEVWLVGANLPGVKPPAGKTQHEFALKIQSLSEADDDRKDEEEMIRGEIAVMQELSHPFMASLYKSYYNEPDSIDMLLGLIPGGELWDVIHIENEETGEWLSGIPETHTQFYAAVVADTLSWMHEKQYVYRDLKPENILLDAKGYPIICDYGFTKKIDKQTFTFCGTPNYVSPEIIKNAGHDGAADWWALGIVIYEAISGENPFYCDAIGDDQMALFAAICDDKPEPLKEGFSKSIVDLIDRLLVKDPSKRLGSGRRRGKDVLCHPFFSGLSIKRLRLKQVRAPWIPGEGKEASSKAFAVALEKERKNNSSRELNDTPGSSASETEALRQVDKEAREQAQRAQRQHSEQAEERKRKDLEMQRRHEEEIRRLEEEEEKRRIEEEDRRWSQQEIRRQQEAEEAERERVARQMEQLLEMRRRQEEEEEDRKRRQVEEQERHRRLEKERLRLEEEERLRQEEFKRLQRHEEEQLRRKEEKRLRQLEQERAEEEAARLAEKERIAAEEEAVRVAEQERMEKEERLRAEEEERLQREKARKVKLRKEAERRRREEEEAERLRLKEEKEAQERVEAERKRKEAKELAKAEDQKRETEKRQREQREEERKDREEMYQDSITESPGKGDGVKGAREQREARIRQSEHNDDNDSRRPQRLDHNWDDAFLSPGGNKKRVSDLGSCQDGKVEQIVDGLGKSGQSPGSMYSPRYQQEVNASIGKGLVAQRLAKAKAKEKEGGVPSMFTHLL